MRNHFKFFGPPALFLTIMLFLYAWWTPGGGILSFAVSFFVLTGVLAIIYLIAQIFLLIFSSFSKKFLRLSLALWLSIVFWLVTIIYAFALIGVWYWMEPLTLDIFFSTLPDIPEIIRSQPTDYSSYLIVGFLFFIGSFLFLIWQSRQLHLSFVVLEKKVYEKPFIEVGLWRIMILASLLLAVRYIVISMTYIEMTGSEENTTKNAIIRTLRQEPFLSVISPGIGFDQFQLQNMLAYALKWKDDSYSIDSTARKNVILIVIDDLRSDHTSLYGYHRMTTPYLDSLYRAKELIKIDFATSLSNFSYVSIPAILFSKRISDFSQDRIGLHQVLKNHGYMTNFILSGLHREWYGLGTVYGSGIDSLWECKDSEHFGANDDFAILDHLKKLDVQQNGNLSFFYFHLMSVHQLGTRSENFAKFNTSAVPAQKTDMDQTIIRTTDHYDNGILQADHVVREIISTLDQKGYLDDATVVITSDHGESLGENGIFSHGGGGININELNIPLLFYGKGRKMIANTHYATHVDIAPTIMYLLGIHPPSDWRGLSLTNSFVPRFTSHYALDDQAILFTDSAACYKYSRNNDINNETIQLFYTFSGSPPPDKNRFIHSGVINQMRKLANKDFR